MFTLKKDKKGIVHQFSFNKPLECFNIPQSWEVIHEKLADEFATMPWNYLTVVVATEPMTDKLWENPKHAHVTNEIWCSEVEEEARKRVQGHYFSPEEIEKVFKENRFPKLKYNWEEAGLDDAKEIEFELKDAIYDAQVKMLYPAIVEELKRECRYEYDEESGEEIKLTPSAVTKKWKKRQMDIFLPRVHESVERVLPNTPEPFGHSSVLAQYYFIEKNDHIEWAMGSSIGSQTRYTQGLMGHLFATLTKKYNKIIHTYSFKNTKQNEFKYNQEWKSLKVDRHELTGNYPVRWENSQSLFEGLLL